MQKQNMRCGDLISGSRGAAKLPREFGVVVFIPYLVKHTLFSILLYRTSRSAHTNLSLFLRTSKRLYKENVRDK